MSAALGDAPSGFLPKGIGRSGAICRPSRSESSRRLGPSPVCVRRTLFQSGPWVSTSTGQPPVFQRSAYASSAKRPARSGTTPAQSSRWHRRNRSSAACLPERQRWTARSGFERRSAGRRALSPRADPRTEFSWGTEGSTSRVNATSSTCLTRATRCRGASLHKSEWAVLGSNQ